MMQVVVFCNRSRVRVRTCIFYKNLEQSRFYSLTWVYKIYFLKVRVSSNPKKKLSSIAVTVLKIRIARDILIILCPCQFHRPTELSGNSYAGQTRPLYCSHDELIYPKE